MSSKELSNDRNPRRDPEERPLARDRKDAAVGDGPGKIGLTSDDQPDLVAPSGVNERDRGAADDQPAAGGTLNFDDDDMAYPRGKTTSTGRAWSDKNPSDAGELGGAPNAGLSDRNGPSDRGDKK